MSKIICGFAGIGKSTAAKKLPGVVDLESTPFNRNWDLYADVAIHMSTNGYTVLLSMHKELRDTLSRKGASFEVAIPPLQSKDQYIARYIERGNDEEFVKLLASNWEKWLDHDFDGMPVTLVDGYLEELLK